MGLTSKQTVEIALIAAAIEKLPHLNPTPYASKYSDLSPWPQFRVLRSGSILATGFAELPPDTDPLQMTLAKPFYQIDLAHAVETAMTAPDARRVLKFRALH